MLLRVVLLTYTVPVVKMVNNVEVFLSGPVLSERFLFNQMAFHSPERKWSKCECVCVFVCVCM